MPFFQTRAKTEMASPATAPPGRPQPVLAPGAVHAVLGRPLHPPFPEGIEQAIFAMGCFWGAERLFWRMEGVHTTAVGYCGGFTPNPTYDEVCSGRTGHAEAVLVAFHADRLPYEALLKVFWEGHDPTQGMRQGNDLGTQYRSAIYWTTARQREAALASRDLYAPMLAAAGHGPITTEVAQAGANGAIATAAAADLTAVPGSTGEEVGAGPFYYAEDYHQQYLAKNPGGYCGLGGTGVACPVGIASHTNL